MRLSILLVIVLVACGDATKPATAIDPYALFYVRNDKATSPIYYAFIRFPNRTPVEESRLGSVGAGEEVCANFGLSSIVPGDPENMVQLVFKVTQDNRDPAANPPGVVIDSLMSPAVDPFALGANTPDTPHRFRLWWKADGSTFFDFGLWNDSTRWAAEPGWPCPTRV